MNRYTHLVIDELVRHCVTMPGDLIVEGELVRRVVSGEVEVFASDVIEEQREAIDELEEEKEKLEAKVEKANAMLDRLGEVLG